MRLGRGIAGVVAATVALGAAGTGTAGAAQVAEKVRYRASDGVVLQGTLRGEAPISARPTVVEFSPYGADSGTFTPGPAYNRLVVEIRGTGGSDGRFDALGPRTQSDVVEVLRWACDQPWTDGNLALNGFSASAITIYNSLHRELPCVKAMILKSGTFELYRDLMTPGGVTNLVPAVAVLAMIGLPATAQTLDRVERDVLGVLNPLAVPAQGVIGVQHPGLDWWWRERGFRGNVNDIPALIVNGLFDVESRGAFEGYQELREDGAHLLITGAHDGSPKGTDGGLPKQHAWLDRYLRGIANGVEHTPRVQMLLSDGSRESYLGGQVVKRDEADWPVPGTRWEPLTLSSERSNSGARSLNDGSMGFSPAPAVVSQPYLALPSLFTSTDPPNNAIIGAMGLDAVTGPLPLLTDMTLSEPLSLTYTTKPLQQDVVSAGPGSVELQLTSALPSTAVWVVLSDVGPDGRPHPLTAGRLNTRYGDIVWEKSRRDPVTQDVVQPYGKFDAPSETPMLKERLYRVELWPVGNRFRKGHRIRLDIVGASVASMPSLPALNLVRVGGAQPSRLLLPVLPGSDLRAALPATPAPKPNVVTSVLRLLGLG